MKRSRIFNTISSKLNKALSKTNKFKETHLLNMKRTRIFALLVCLAVRERRESTCSWQTSWYGISCHMKLFMQGLGSAT